MAFNIAANTYQPNFGKAAISGFQAGQEMRKSALEQQSIQQGMQQSALESAQGQEDRQTQQMGAQASQVTDQTSYDRFRMWMKESLGETEVGLLEDGLVPEYNDSVAAVLQGSVGIAQGVPSRQKDYTLGEGSQRISGKTGKVIARTPRRPAAVKQLPMNFAKNFKSTPPDNFLISSF